MVASSSSAKNLVLASTFYTAALEQPLTQALVERAKRVAMSCVPYNQLHTFLLDPESSFPKDGTASVVLVLRVEDLIRTDLVSGAQSSDGQIQALRARTEEFLNVVSRISRLRLTAIVCPSGRGAFDLKPLGNALRVAEHKIVAELRRQQKHVVISWSEIEQTAPAQNCFNAAADRLGHVPFSPEGMQAIAGFVADRLETLPSTSLIDGQATKERTDLQQFLASLDVELKVAPMSDIEEEVAVNLVRHTTHFVNLANRKWQRGDIRSLASAQPNGEAWSIRARDRFGDYGISGAITFGIREHTMSVGLLFLTCPVLGRQVEYGLFAWIADLAEQRNLNSIEIPFTPGRDNRGLQSLLASLAADSRESADSSMTYRLSVQELAERSFAEAPNPASVRSMVGKLLSERVQMSV